MEGTVLGVQTGQQQAQAITDQIQYPVTLVQLPLEAATAVSSVAAEADASRP